MGFEMRYVLEYARYNHLKFVLWTHTLMDKPIITLICNRFQWICDCLREVSAVYPTISHRYASNIRRICGNLTGYASYHYRYANYDTRPISESRIIIRYSNYQWIGGLWGGICRSLRVFSGVLVKLNWERSDLPKFDSHRVSFSHSSFKKQNNEEWSVCVAK